ncbi:hypothetical protein RQM47_08740 [Rubrivirga sp. S365]|uniref:Uncharacterized protein n=1 Tax=Rubrivirga litoralis TaxID=3075598 RepID=A0ABU3BTT8_9BACT|nr:MULTISPECIES: hypothetical protein [unclassified Rubrivirga]MDT0632586.1 hypothetical protein [Rubrivirga sp. F394]MDT7856724.1 hypothetical protein [Rubrivirga sp. S365]
MTRSERLGLTALAGGVGLALTNVLAWALGRGVGVWRPALSGLLMVVGLALLAVEVVRARRDASEGGAGE